MDSIKVAKLVEEYLKAQSLKILPQAPFGDAVTQFVDKDDKHAMEQFVIESLSGQVQQMLNLENDDENLDQAMETIKQKLEHQFNAGQLKRGPKLRYKPKPAEWDSDLEGHWEDQAQAIDRLPVVEAAQEPAKPRSRARKPIRTGFLDDDDDDGEMNDIAEDDEEIEAPKTRGRPKAAVTRAKAAPKAAAKKAPPKGRGRGRKQVEEEDEDDDDNDVVMDDDNYDPPAPPLKRTTTTRATTTRSQPSRSQASRATSSAATSAAKTRQTILNFSQKATQQEPLEISDDEISDDPFETAPATRTRRR